MHSHLSWRDRSSASPPTTFPNPSARNPSGEHFSSFRDRTWEPRSWSKYRWAIQEDGRMRVLLADDHPLFRDGLAALLRARGMTVVGEANNGTEALELARAIKPE